MDIELDVRKSVDENAVVYFEKAKKAKRKLSGAEKALRISEMRKQKLLEQKNAEKAEQEKPQIIQRKWFEKFRWFTSSEDFLCIGGRDITTNEIVIKKYTEKEDLVFHTQMQGSPFFVIKAKNRSIGEKTLEEAGIAVASFSRAWRLGITDTEVFYVKPSQLSKTAKAGEYVERGAFIISGKINTLIVSLQLAVGMTKENMIMCGPVSAVRKNCSKYVMIKQGNNKTSDVAKAIKKRIGGDLDSIIRVLPSGGIKIL